MSFATVAALRESIVSAGNLNPAYVERMIHRVPEMPTIKNREAWLVEKARALSVLDVGCTGPVSDAIRKVARVYHGVDVQVVPGCELLDIDKDPRAFPKHEGIEIIIMAEVLEHLGNPGNFLEAVRDIYPGVPLCITVPHAGGYQTHNGAEVVNVDHVTWFSYTTLKTLLARYGYRMHWACWYNGEPHRAEGLLVEARP